jgi:hypothetical protein
MKSDLSSRDWQEISSYVDRQLSVEAQVRLEERLQNEQDLRSALEDLRRTRVLLRSQPRLRAPRNFTLTSEMVGKRPSAPAYPVLGLVSALASLLFIVLLVGDLLNQRTALAPARIKNELQAEVVQSEAANSHSPAAPDEVEATPALEAAPMAAPFASTEVSLGTQPPAAAAKMIAPPPTPGETAASPPAEAAPKAILPPSVQAQQPGSSAAPSQEPGGLSSDRTSPSVTAPQIFGLNQIFWHGLETLAAILAVAAGLAWWIRRPRL